MWYNNRTMNLLWNRNRYSSAHNIWPDKQLKIIKNGQRREEQRKILKFCPDFATRVYFSSFSKALCSAVRIFFTSSDPEATSSDKYLSTVTKPASDLSAIPMSLSRRLVVFDAAFRDPSSLRINPETSWFSEFSRSTMDLATARKQESEKSIRASGYWTQIVSCCH